MKSIPTTWTGNWVDDIGRTLTIEVANDREYKVSIKDSSGIPFKINWTGFGLFDKKTTDLKSEITKDNNGRQHLQVEAGMVGVGPTYRLYFVVDEGSEKLRLATSDDKIEKIKIKPDVGIGLYDDWEDDLGVPWALPLSDYKKA
jgi:hypothetical protein